jgi:predicted phosphodiesterase
VLFCHGSPRDDEEPILPSTSPADLAVMLAGVDAELVVFGHTHTQLVWRAGGKLLLNPGSVGLPRGARGAHWALLGPGIELRRTEYDIEAAAELVRASGLPSADAAFAAPLLAPPPVRV